MSAERRTRRTSQDANQGTRQPEMVQAGSSAVVTEVTEPIVETPANRITQKFVKAIYRDGGNIVTELDAAQNDIFGQADIVESLRLLHTLSAIGLEAAQGQTDPGLIEAVTNKQKGYASALRRLDPRFARENPTMSQSTTPSNLPPMTGRKG